MLISGEWFPCPDDVVRPVILGEVLSGIGSWIPIPFLLDTGADRTVLSAAVLSRLALPLLDTPERIGGLGGVVDSVVFDTNIQLTRETGAQVLFRGQFAAVTDAKALDMSVLGRDITDNFGVIVDRPQDAVCLVSRRHSYNIIQT